MSDSHQTLPAFGRSHAAWASGKPEQRARFKATAEDFIVEEVLGFEPSGEGEHLFLWLQTDDHNTRHTQRCLARTFQVARRHVSYSGLKDRRGLTRQWFSLHLPGQNPEPDVAALASDGIELLSWARHHRKLRIGTHQSNRFCIFLRQIELSPEVERRLQRIRKSGVPNYFGAQRFGRNASNIAAINNAISNGELPAEREQRSLLLSAMRSWVFNGVLSQRIEQGTWCQWQPDDLIQLDGSRSFFQEESWSEKLQQRFDEGDIHLAQWLPGCDQAATVPADMKALFQLADLKAEPRPLRLLPRELKWQWQSEGLALQFNLPKGAYATSVLRELVQLEQT